MHPNSAAKKSPCASRGLFTNHVIEMKLAKSRTRLRDFHENNHEREQHQRLDEGQTQNQRHLNASPRRRIAPARFACRRRGAAPAHAACAARPCPCAANPAAMAIAKPEVIATQLLEPAVPAPACANAGTA